MNELSSLVTSENLTGQMDNDQLIGGGFRVVACGQWTILKLIQRPVLRNNQSRQQSEQEGDESPRCERKSGSHYRGVDAS